MTVASNLLGRIFGSLSVVARAANDRHGKSRWDCSCSCGNTTTVHAGDLLAGKTISCGCQRDVMTGDLRRTHSLSDTSLHHVWRAMKQRCNNPKHKSFPDYGGRGISVCERWQKSFEAFLADMGPKPSALHTIDRINNDGNYEPGNVQWATRLVQRHNRRNKRAA